MTPSGIAALIRRPDLHVHLAQVGLAVFVVKGFGAPSRLPLAYGAGMALLAAAIVILSPPRASTRVRVPLSIGLLLGWWIVSGTWAPDPRAWMAVTWATIPAVLALLAIGAIVPIERAAPGLLAGCYVVIGWCLLVSLLIDPISSTTNPDFSQGWRGSFPHRNRLAMFLAFALPTIAILERRRAWKVGGLAVGLGLLVMSRSVTGILTIIVTSAAAAWLGKYHALERRPAKAFATTTLAVAALAVVLAVACGSWVLPRLGKDASLTGRTRVWRAVGKAVQASPLVGHGVGVWANRERPPVADIARELGWYPYSAHNGLLELLFALGAVGAGLYLVVVLETLVGAWRRSRPPPDPSRWALLVGVVTITLSISEPAVLGPWLGALVYARMASRAADPGRDGSAR